VSYVTLDELLGPQLLEDMLATIPPVKQSARPKPTPPMLSTWRGMMQRCTNPNSQAWPNYGGRGIKVCDRWLEYENFILDMGERPEGRTIDRIDNNGDYSPENCRWSTSREQALNKRTTLYAELNGRSLPVQTWADLLGVTPVLVQAYLLVEKQLKALDVE